MSLILEALRRSESERRRGQVPDLFAELPAPRRRARRVPSPAWAALALPLVVAAAWWLWRSAPPAAPEPAAAPALVAAPELAPPPQPAPPPAPEAAPTPRPDPATPNAAPRFAEPAAAPPAADVPAGTGAAPGSAPAGDLASAPGGQATTGEPETSDTAAADSTTTASAAPAEADTENTVDAPAAGSANAAPAASEILPRLADLSPAERQQLPALKLSMHVWAPAPAQRFVIVDGARLGEGARVGEAVIAEITRDGLVLDWQGRRLALARP